jgi:hypothetical protein
MLLGLLVIVDEEVDLVFMPNSWPSTVFPCLLKT